MSMPWQETDICEEKFKFVLDWKKNEFSFTELCKRYKISRPSGYLLINRYERYGLEGLKARSKAPNSIPHKTSFDLEEQLLKLKYRFPNWGPGKIKDYIEQEGLEGNWPAASTIGEIFKRHGLVKSRKKRKQVIPHAHPLNHCLHPNSVWSADFKGQFKLRNNTYCYPLTITDNYSRFLFACDGFLSPNCDNTIKTFRRIFREYGLPDAIRTDNGQPFCGIGSTSLTRLTIWFIRLGIAPERINLGAPQENGRHERMHRTLKEAAIVAGKNSLKEQQRKFDDFIYEYNKLRPHLGLNGKRPNDVYHQSLKLFPEKLTEIIYPDEFIIRVVKNRGQIKFAGKQFYISALLYGETLGLEMIDECRAFVYFNKMKLGILDLKLDKIVKPY